MNGRVLVAGFSTRHVAQSAARAGYEVCAVDHFCDQDLSWFTTDREKFDDLDDLPDAIDQSVQTPPVRPFCCHLRCRRPVYTTPALRDPGKRHRPVPG